MKQITRQTKNLHLYVSRGCPFAHRALIMRQLHNLDNITVDVVDPVLRDKGWVFSPSKEGCTKDSVYGFDTLRQVYEKVDPGYSGSITVPLLIDTQTNKLVSNESAQIAEMMDGTFDDKVRTSTEFVHKNITMGVYKAGFAKDQTSYNEAIQELFSALNKVEKDLKESQYLVGDSLTAADVFLYTSIVRFDPVYVQRFKCNVGMVRYNFAWLHLWLRHLYWQVSAFRDTTDFSHIKQLYYDKSDDSIIPAGPVPDIEEL
ncbi:Glutathione S-transferase omega-like 2 [Yarrowia sp. C11]|nr:Glutathione S-transferase omega-like 2 [Yarrowia sp. E02]KAG5371555.1 Glutathione S-transferase omega-like 2 [Yarrowia sp. C11]